MIICYFEPYDTAPLINRYAEHGFEDYGATYVVYPVGHGYDDGDYYKPGIALQKVWCDPRAQGVPGGPYLPNEWRTRWVSYMGTTHKWVSEPWRYR